MSALKIHVILLWDKDLRLMQYYRAKHPPSIEDRQVLMLIVKVICISEEELSRYVYPPPLASYYNYDNLIVYI